MKTLFKTVSLFSLFLLSLLLIVSCTQIKSSKVNVNIDADIYSNIILSFDETIKPSSELSSETNPNANITDENVINRLKKYFQGKKPEYFKYENNLLKAFYSPENMPLDGEKLVVLKGLPIFAYMENKYNYFAKTSNNLNLVFKGNRFILDETVEPKEVVSKMVEITYQLTDTNTNFGYKGINTKVTKFLKENNDLLISYTYETDKDSSFELYKTQEVVKDNLIVNDLDTNILVYKKDISKESKNTLEKENIFVLQDNEDIINFSYDLEKENIYVLFSSKLLNENDNLNIYSWNIEPKQDWPGQLMQKRKNHVYSSLLNTPSKDEAFGLIFSVNNEKLTGNLLSNSELLEPLLNNENKIKFLFITSDEKNDTNTTVKAYNLDTLSEFLEYLK